MREIDSNDFLPFHGRDLAGLVMTARDLVGTMLGNLRLQAVTCVFLGVRGIDSNDSLPFLGHDLTDLVMTGRDLAGAMSGNQRLRAVLGVFGRCGKHTRMTSCHSPATILRTRL